MIVWSIALKLINVSSVGIQIWPRVARVFGWQLRGTSVRYDVNMFTNRFVNVDCVSFVQDASNCRAAKIVQPKIGHMHCVGVRNAIMHRDCYTER